MMPAAKHGDPQLGVDIHMCAVPPSPSPVPLPTPHMSIVFDPFDYAPIFGATVTVCGMKRATAGTNAMVVHIPPGFPIVPTPKPPEKDDELFMGSATVVADGDPFSYIAVPVLSCQIAGMPSIPRLRKKGPKKLMLLPLTVNLAIPTNVFVGGPPTISLIGMAFKGAFAALGKFAKSGVFKKMRKWAADKLNLKKPGFFRCKVFRAEPVSILNGSVSVEQQDFVLPGRIPIEWDRTYRSDSTHTGVCGRGWETLADTRMEISAEDGLVQVHCPTFGLLSFNRLPVATGEEAAELELMDGSLLVDQGDEFRITTKEDRIYHFPKDRATTDKLGRPCWPIGRISDRCGNALTFEYRDGHVVTINESAGRRLALTVEHNRLTAITLIDPATRDEHLFVRYEYDQNGDLVAAIDALDAPYRFAFDDHRLVRHTDRKGLSFYYEYSLSDEGDWRVIHAWGDGGLYDYRFEYLDALNERRITDSLGHVTTVKLDEDGLPISEIDPLGGITIFEYDDVGRTTAVVDPGGHRTEYEYDERGNLLKLTRPDGTCIKTEFNSAGKAINIIDPNGAVWQQEWDERGLLISQTTPLGNVSRYEYDANGQLVALSNPRSARTELTFDTVGNLISLKDALGHSTAFVYDPLGSVTGKTDPLGHETLYHYDGKSRLTEARLPSGATIRCVYDAEDYLTRYVDENGVETRLEYAGLGEIKLRIQPDGYSVEYHYDTEERLVGVTNQRGETYQLKRDASGRIVEAVDYWGQVRRYDYDVSGHLTASTDPLGRTISYATDPFGRILKKTLPDGFVEEFVYDANGNLVEAQNPNGAIKCEFDAEGRLTEELQAGFSISNTYDSTGNRITRETSLGNKVVYKFDAIDQVTSICINQEEPMQIERNAAGRIALERLSPQVTRHLQYSDDGNLTKQTVSVNDSPLFNTRFYYDAAGNLTRRSDSQYGADVYYYDPLGRITEHLDPRGRVTRYLNDPAGDRLRTRIVDSVRRRVVGGGVEEGEWSREGQYEGTYYRFNRAGNLVEQRDGEHDLYLIWDTNQRLIESHADGVITRYGYDPLGRRLFKETENGRTLCYWDTDALVGEAVVALNRGNDSLTGIEENVVALDERRKHAGGAVPLGIREYLYYPDTFEPLALIEGSGEYGRIYHYHNDPNGCPTRLTDADGEVKWGASYTALGEIAELYLDKVGNPIRLQGQYADGETTLYYNRYRYYSAAVGQFVSSDPLRLRAGLNVYSYGPNVQGWIDPLGLAAKCAGKSGYDLEDAVRKKLDDEGIPHVQGRKIGNKGEIDFETPKVIIEVTIKKKGKLSQVKDKYINDPAFNPGKKPVILFAPDYGKAASKDVSDAGALVINDGKTLDDDLDSLVALIK